MMFDPCNEECVFFRKGLRYSDRNDEPIPFEDCAINIIADNLEVMHNRSYMLQKEVGDTKNIIAMKTMVDLGVQDPSHRETLIRQVINIINPPQDKKQIKQ